MVEMVHVTDAAKEVGVSSRTLRRWWRRGHIVGKVCGDASLFVDVASICEHNRSASVAERRDRRARVRARELVCLVCTVPGGCHPGDLRCRYNFPEEDSDGDKN